MTEPTICPWCGDDLREPAHRRGCPQMSNILTESLRAAVRADREARDAEIAEIADRLEAPKVMKIDNTGPTMILGRNIDRGLAFIRNSDFGGAVEYIGTDERNMNDPIKRFTLPPGAVVVLTSPSAVYAIGSSAAVQTIEVMELAPGRASPFAVISDAAGGGTGSPGVFRFQDGTSLALAGLSGNALIARIGDGAGGFATVTPVPATNDGLAAGTFNGFAVYAQLAAFNGATSDKLRTLGAGDGLGALLVGEVPSSPFSDAPAANTAAIRTFAAVAGQAHRLTICTYSFTAAPAAGSLTIADGATTVYQEPVSAGPNRIPLHSAGIKGSVNTNLVVTLPAGGVGVSGVLNTAKKTA